MAGNLINSIEDYCVSRAGNTCIQKYNAYSMADVYQALSDMGENVFHNTGSNFGRPLWFRGQDMEAYMLVPSLFRDRENQKNEKGSYSTLSLAEEYRHQNFSARVSHLVQSDPRSRVEWQEVLQHHFGKTRFMDWSESVETAVNFALEAFIDTKDTEDNRKKRSVQTPGIWVVNPYRLNEHVYDFFADKRNVSYIKKALQNIISEDKRDVMASDIQKELEENKHIYFNFGEKEIIDIAISGLVSVCILDKHYHYNAEHMEQLLQQREFNPFFYLVVRYYADALPVDAGVRGELLLPPVASIQPYHSERIRAQRGTFTIFPNYCRTEEAKLLAGTKLDVVAIESQKGISDCFCNIRLCDPAKIASELIYAGERRPEMYPDMQAYADYLETKRFFV